MNRRPLDRLNPPARALAVMMMTMTTASLLCACGGGGNESGPPDSILLSPAAVSVMGPHLACARGIGPTVFVYGGTPPYTLNNSYALGMTLDKQSLKNSGDGFTITFNGVCMESVPITVQDDMGRISAVGVTNVAGL
jgi:hypothetical protein